MKLIKDLWGWLKEWNDWQLKDWIKASILVVVVLFVLWKMSAGGGAQPVWHLLLKPLIGVAGDAVKGFVTTKKLKAEQKLTKIKADTKLMEDQIAGKVKWEASAVEQMKGSWKDELILICLLAPAVAVFFPGMTDHIEKGFLALHALPDYYKHLLYIACSASFGIKGAAGAMNYFKKK